MTSKGVTTRERVLIAFAGWEDRFVLGVERDLARFDDLDAVCIFYFLEFASMTEDSRRAIEERYGTLEFVP